MIMQAQEYHQSLISQGYSAEQAKQYTVQHYPDFEPTMPTPNVAHHLPEIPVSMPLPGISPLPLGDLPPPFVGGALPKPKSVGIGGMEKKKIISIALAGILVLAGAVGIMYAFGVFEEGDGDFVGEWVDEDGTIVAYNGNGTINSYQWWMKDDPYGSYWPFETSWEKSGDVVTATYERTVTSNEFPYDEKTTIVMKIKIDGGIMFMALLEGARIEDYDYGEVKEYDLLEEPGENCVAFVSKERIDFTDEYWNATIQNTWFSMVNSVDIPSWCDNEFKNEYSFSFEQDDSFFYLTLENTKWDRLEISDMAFYITVDEGSEIECFYDGYDGVCSYIPQFGSDFIATGMTIRFYQADAWDADCSSGCDLYVRVVQNTDSGQILIDEFSESNLAWD